jgi:hypothetical protein
MLRLNFLKFLVLHLKEKMFNIRKLEVSVSFCEQFKYQKSWKSNHWIGFDLWCATKENRMLRHSTKQWFSFENGAN